MCSSPHPSSGSAKLCLRTLAASSGRNAEKYISPKKAASRHLPRWVSLTARSNVRAWMGLITERLPTADDTLGGRHLNVGNGFTVSSLRSTAYSNALNRTRRLLLTTLAAAALPSVLLPIVLRIKRSTEGSDTHDTGFVCCSTHLSVSVTWCGRLGSLRRVVLNAHLWRADRIK